MKRLKRFDIILAVALIAISVVAFVVIGFLKKDGRTVIIKQDDKVVYEGELSKDDTVSLEHNRVRIKDGEAYMEYSDCKNRICINTGKISKSGEFIACLPNRVLVEIK